MKIRTGNSSRQDFVTRQIGTETIVVPVRGGVGDLNFIFTLNEAGTDIWRLLREGKTFDEVVDALCALYRVSPEEAAADTREFVDNLKASGLFDEMPGKEG